MLEDSQRQIIRAGSKPSLESWPIRAQNNKLNQQQQAKDCVCGEESRERASKSEKGRETTTLHRFGGREGRKTKRERRGNMDRLSERDRMIQSYWALHSGMPVGKSVIMSLFAFFPFSPPHFLVLLCTEAERVSPAQQQLQSGVSSPTAFISYSGSMPVTSEQPPVDGAFLQPTSGTF